MNQRLKYALLLSAACFLPILSGCGGTADIPERESSPSVLLEKVQEQTESLSSYIGHLSAQMELKQQENKLRSGLDYTIEYSNNPEFLHVTGTLANELPDSQEDAQEVQVESYMVTDGEESKMYTLTNDSWLEESADENESDVQCLALFQPVFDQSDSFQIEDGWETFDGESVYSLNGSVSGEEVTPWIQVLTGSDVEKIDDGVSAEVSLYIYQDARPARLSIEICDGNNQLSEILGYENTEIENLSIIWETVSFDPPESCSVPEDVLESARLNEIYQHVVSDQTNRELEKDEDGDYILGDFYQNQYTVSVSPRSQVTIDEENSGSGWLYFTYDTDEGNLTGTYYLMPVTDEYGTSAITAELDDYYDSLSAYEGSEVTRLDELLPMEIDGHETVMDRIDYRFPEEGYHGSMRNYCMVVDEVDGLVVQCVVTEILYEEDTAPLFTDEELAEELLSGITVTQ